MGTGCLPKSSTVVEEQGFVFESIPRRRMPPSSAAPWVAGQSCGPCLASPRLLWGPSQAPKACPEHGPSPDTLPGPGSESQPRSCSAPACCSWPPWQSCAGHPAPGHCLPITASRLNNSLSLYSFLVPASAPFFPSAAMQTPARNTRFWLPLTLSGRFLDAQDADLS